MCDKGKVWFAYGMVVTPLAVAIALAITAMSTNVSWWVSWASVGLMFGSIGAVTLAFSALINFRSVLDAYINCMIRTGSKSCNGISSGTNSLQIIAASTAMGSLLILGYNAAAWAWFPGAGLIPMGVYLVALGLLIALVAAMAPSLGALISCLETPLVTTPPPSPPISAGNLTFKVVTCTLNKSTCAEDQMVDAVKMNTPMQWQVSPTSALLLKGNTSNSISSINAKLTDGYNNRIALSGNLIKKPNTHNIRKEPDFHAVLLDWDVLTSEGIRLEQSSRNWDLDIDIRFADQSQQKLSIKLRVTM